MPYSGTLKNLYIYTSNTSTDVVDVAIFINGSISALLCEVLSTATSCNDTIHNVSVVAGDRIELRNVNSRTGAVKLGWSMEYDPT